MKSFYLIEIANSIGDFAVATSDAEEAKWEVARHICLFWSERMRVQLVQYLDDRGGLGLKPLVVEALKQYRFSIIKT